MNNPLKSFSQATHQLGFVALHQCVNASEIKELKRRVQESYNHWGSLHQDTLFLNWGLWDKKLYEEYQALPFVFASIDHGQSIYPQLLVYYLIRPLVKAGFFNKRLLEIGCGNGIGLRVGAELLKADYAMGIDLVNTLVTHATKNFYQENKVNYLQTDSENLALADESFDIITNLESSHLYPDIESFFSEVERVLAPGGFFCYSDIHTDAKQQVKRLEIFLKSRKNLRIILKTNITHPVQTAIYQRVIVHENDVCKYGNYLFNNDKNTFLTEFAYLVDAMGLSFLPWWKIWFKNPKLHTIAKFARQNYWGGGKKLYFYYLIQKVTT